MGGTGPRDGLSRSMSSVFVDPPPLKDVLGSSALCYSLFTFGGH